MENHTQQQDSKAQNKKIKYNTQKIEKYAIYLLQKTPTSMDSQRIMFVYFCLAILDFLNSIDKHFSQEFKQDLTDWIYSLQIINSENKDGGFQGNHLLGIPYHKSLPEVKNSNTQKNLQIHEKGHIVYSYSAILSLKILGDDLSRLRKQNIIKHLQNLQQPNGSVKSVEILREQDLRFLYSSLVISQIIDDFSGINIEKAIEYIMKCQNSTDGAFSLIPGLESHGGATYCAVASLHILKKLDIIPHKTRLIKWLVNRQQTVDPNKNNSDSSSSGDDDDENDEQQNKYSDMEQMGLNGRINKDPDSCYTFWIGSTLKFLGCEQFLNRDCIEPFLKTCESQIGGFCKYPFMGQSDPIHTLHSLYGLQLINCQQPEINNNDNQIDFSIGIKKSRI